MYYVKIEIVRVSRSLTDLTTKCEQCNNCEQCNKFEQLTCC